MNRSAFTAIARTEECLRFAFLGFAHALSQAKRPLIFDRSHYNPEFGLSIVISYTTAHDYLELCIVSMGYQPSAEAGTVRVVIFPSVEEKEAFKTQFTAHYEEALITLKLLSGMQPEDYLRMKPLNTVKLV